MSVLNLQGSNFAVANPLDLLDRWFHGYRYRQNLHLDGRPLELCFTGRALRALERRSGPLVIELQLYFSCVIKKRVLFHERVDFATTRVDDQIEIAFRAVASSICNPVEFARSQPAGRDLTSGPAAAMVPSMVEIDYRADAWQGRFEYSRVK